MNSSKEPINQQETLTTGQVSRICNVAPRTVCRWFDKGLLRGYRVPNTKGRRIPVTELIKFMKEHKIYTEISQAD